MSLFKVKSAVGLEMDAYEVRAAEVGGTAVKPSLLGLGRAYLPEGVVKDGKVVRPDLLGGIISRLWTDARFKSRNVILGVSNQDVLIRTALIPRCPPDKLDSAIRFQAQDFLPVSINDVELDYIVLDDMAKTQAETIRVLLVAGRRGMLNGFLQAVGAAGLKLIDIDVSLLAMARLARKQAKNQVLAVVHFTKEQAGMAILDNGLPVLARILPVSAAVRHAGESGDERYAADMTAAVSDRSDARQDEIPDEKPGARQGEMPDEKPDARQDGRDGQGFRNENDDSGAFPGSLSEVIIGEIGSFISYFLSQDTGAVIEKCMINFVAGHAADLKNKLGERLGIAIEVIDPTKELNLYRLSGNHSFTGAADFSAAISLALRGLEE
jgi:type IV pilus assembly protein PilM